MNKKFLSCVCAGAMALSLAAPAFAAGNPIGNDASVTFTGAAAEGEIAVVMQTGGRNLYVNPYGLPYTLGFGEVFVSGGNTFDATKDLAIKEPDTASEGFFSDTAVIQNNGNIALDVKVSMTTTEKGNAKVVLAANMPTAGNVTAQYMSGNLEIAPATESTGTAKVTTTAAQVGPPAVDAVKTEVDNVKIITPNWASKKTVAIPAGSGNAGTAGAPSAVADTQIDLPAATTSENLGTITTTPGYVAYRLAGTTAPMDKESAPSADDVAPWDSADVADVTVAFTFTPVAAYSITEGSHTDASSDISAVAFKVNGSAVTSASAGDTVTIEVTATSGKTITASMNGGSAISLTGSSGTYTGTFTMPAANATVVLTVA